MPGSRPRTCRALLLLALVTAVSGRARADITIADPGTFVVDQADVLDAARRSQLEKWLKELEQKTTAQVKLLTVRTADGEDFFSFVQRHYDLWKLGKKGKSNGALIVLDVGEHHVRIHTGYGLEGVLPDSWCGSLSRATAQQYFSQGKFGDGIYQLTLAVANQVADDAGVKLTGMPEVRHQPENNAAALLTIFLIFLAIMIFFAWRNSKTKGRGRVGGWGPTYGGGFGGGFWGDSFGGGFSGSAGGGGGFDGGGSFGGGGSSGGGGGGASW